MTGQDGRQGEFASEKQIGKVDDVLGADETVRYIAQGNNAKAKFRDSTTSFDNTKGWPRLVATDRRVFIKVPKLLTTKVESVNYAELTAVDFGSDGMTGTEIKLRTNRGKTYIFRATKPDEVELQEMLEFIRDKITGSETPETAAPSAQESPNRPAQESRTRDEALHKTDSCIECGGAVSDGVLRCPNCGYNPSDHRTWWGIHCILGGLFAATGIGLLVLPYFVWMAYKHYGKYRGGVTG